MRRRRGEGGHYCLCRIQGNWGGWCGTRAANSRRCASGKAENNWPKLPRGDESLYGLERHLCKCDRPTGKRRVHQSEQCLLYFHIGLEFWRERRIQRLCINGFHAGCRMGRFNLLPRRRPPHSGHRDLYGIGRRCAIIFLRSP